MIRVPIRMRRLLAFVPAVLVLLSPAVAWAKTPTPPPPARPDDKTLLVKFTTTREHAVNVVQQLGDTAGATVSGATVVRIRPGATLSAKLHEYGSRADVAYAEPNYARTTDAVAPPNDPYYEFQWGLPAVHAQSAWGVYPGAYLAGETPPNGPAIAVVDTGVDTPHPDLASSLDTADSATCTSDTGVCTSSSAMDDQGHGTHVAGIASARTNNGIGVAGLSFNSPIIPVKVLDSTGEGTDADVAAGINWAVSKGAKVINLSLGGYGSYPTTLCTSVANAVSSGVVVVAAAGNDGITDPHYPSACPGAIGVAATDSSGASPDFSNWGSPNVFISAPGVSIVSTMWSGTGLPGCVGLSWCYLQGTSMATPFVSAVAALLVGHLPASSPADVKYVLASTAQKVGANLYPPLAYGTDPYGTCGSCTWHPYYGYGLVDAFAALLRPRITAMNPTHAQVGQQVVLTGTNFVGVTAVSLALVNASYTVDSPTQITVTVPTIPYTAGRWRVTNPGGTGLYDPIFTVDPAPVPTITAMNPTHAQVGQQVVLTGTNFVGVTAVSLALVNASYTVDSPTQITVTVPTIPYTTGRWRVSNAGGTGLFDPIFTVDP
jgi:Subtilase family/IPT/TIG domain